MHPAWHRWQLVSALLQSKQGTNLSLHARMAGLASILFVRIIRAVRMKLTIVFVLCCALGAPAVNAIADDVATLPVVNVQFDFAAQDCQITFFMKRSDYWVASSPFGQDLAGGASKSSSHAMKQRMAHVLKNIKKDGQVGHQLPNIQTYLLAAFTIWFDQDSHRVCEHCKQGTRWPHAGGLQKWCSAWC